MTEHPRDAASARTPLNLRLLLLAAGAYAILARWWDLVQSPRLWAEDGTMFFHTAWTLPWYKALVAPHAGYFLFVPNATGVIAARWFSLERAASAFLWASLLFQLLPLALVLLGRISGLASRGRLLVGALALLVLPPSDELWLNMACIQFHLALATFLLAIEVAPPLTRLGTWLRRALLVLAGTTGPLSALLFPLFALKGFVLKRREFKLQAALLLGCLLVQVAAHHANNENAREISVPDWGTVAVVVATRTIVDPVMGPRLARPFAERLYADRAQLDAIKSPWLMLGTVAGVALLLFGLVAGRRRLEAALWLGGYCIMTMIPIVGSLGSDKSIYLPLGNGSRYFYGGAAVFALLTTTAVGLSSSWWGRLRTACCSIVLCFALVESTLQFHNGALWSPGWPEWPQEVAAWRQDPQREIRIWPPPWSMKLDTPKPR